MVLRIDSKVTCTALGLAVAIILHMIHHVSCHARASERTRTELDSSTREQMRAALRESKLTIAELAVEPYEAEHVHQVTIQFLQLKGALARRAIHIAF